MAIVPVHSVQSPYNGTGITGTLTVRLSASPYRVTGSLVVPTSPRILPASPGMTPSNMGRGARGGSWYTTQRLLGRSGVRAKPDFSLSDAPVSDQGEWGGETGCGGHRGKMQKAA